MAAKAAGGGRTSASRDAARPPVWPPPWRPHSEIRPSLLTPLQRIFAWSQPPHHAAGPFWCVHSPRLRPNPTPQVVALLPTFFYPSTRVLAPRQHSSPLARVLTPTPQSFSSSPQFHPPLSVCVLVLPIHSNSPLSVLVAPPTFYSAPPAFEPLCQSPSAPRLSSNPSARVLVSPPPPTFVPLCQCSRHPSACVLIPAS